MHEELLKKDNSTYISTTIRGQYYLVKDGRLYIFDDQGLVKILEKQGKIAGEVVQHGINRDDTPEIGHGG